MATATVQKVAVGEPEPAPEAAVGDAEPVRANGVFEGEIVTSVEVVDATTAADYPVQVSTVDNVVENVEIFERPIYETRTVYRVVDRPRIVRTYHTSWIYDPARYYVFRDYGGWTYRYFAGTWDWRCYDLGFRHPRRHQRSQRHNSRDSRDHRSHRDDRHRGDRDRRDDRGERRDRHRGDRDRRDDRGERRDRHRSGTTRVRRVDPTHLRQRVASRRNVELRHRNHQNGSERGLPRNPRLRALHEQARSTRERTQANRAPSVRREGDEQRVNPFKGQTRTDAITFRREAAPRTPARTTPTPTVAPSRHNSETRRTARPSHTVDPRGIIEPGRPAEARRRAEPRAEPRQGNAVTRSVTPPSAPTRATGERWSQEVRPNARARPFEREAQRRSSTVTSPRQAVEPRRAPAVSSRQARPEDRGGNARTRVFNRQAEPRIPAPVNSARSQDRPPAQGRAPVQSRAAAQGRAPAQARARSVEPVRSAPPRQAPPRQVSPRPSRSQPSPSTERKPSSNSASPRPSTPAIKDAPPSERKSRNPRTRGMEEER